MALRSRLWQDALLAGCFWLLLGQVCPSMDMEDNRAICQLPKETGLCKAAFPRWYFCRYTKTCKWFIYGGCGGNGNNFESEEECEQICG